MYNFPLANVEVGVVTLAAAGIAVDCLTRSRPKGEEIVTLEVRARAEILKLGIEDAEKTQVLLKEFLKETNNIARPPSEYLWWGFSLPLYQLESYFIERRAFNALKRKAKCITSY